MNTDPPTTREPAPRPAFTLLELLVLLGLLAVLAAVAVPAFSGTQPNSHVTRCLSNHRRLITAWQMYAEDNGGRMVPAWYGTGDPSPQIPWARGWLDWSLHTDNTNILFLVNDRYAQLGQYVNRDPSVFKCPADRYLASAQRARGWAQRARSVSQSACLGASNVEAGPWNPTYAHLTRISEFLYPSAAEAWVYMDEHPHSINDGVFYNPNQGSFSDIPAGYHRGGATVAFADGHTEVHRWTRSLPTDLHWLSYHSSRTSTNSY